MKTLPQIWPFPAVGAVGCGEDQRAAVLRDEFADGLGIRQETEQVATVVSAQRSISRPPKPRTDASTFDAPF